MLTHEIGNHTKRYVDVVYDLFIRVHIFIQYLFYILTLASAPFRFKMQICNLQKLQLHQIIVSNVLYVCCRTATTKRSTLLDAVDRFLANQQTKLNSTGSTNK